MKNSKKFDINPKKHVSQVISYWTGIKARDIERYIDETTTYQIYNCLESSTSATLTCKLTKRYIAKLLIYLPSPLRYKVTNVLKQLRNIHSMPIKEINEYMCVKLCNNIKRKVGIENRKWNGKKFVICVTHDVDYPEGYDNIHKIVDMEESYRIHSSWNFLTDGTYPLKKDSLIELKDRGFEIGLHGYSHDIAFGYRNKNKIRKQLLTSLKKIPNSPKGFRAPGLSYSKELLLVLSELGFVYDSSIPDRDIGTCYPYIYPGTNIWELPLTTPQDSELFRDRNLTDKEAFDILVTKINSIKEVGGIAVLLFHPCIIIDHPDFYEKILLFITSQGDAWITTPGEFVKYLNANYVMVI